MAALRDLNREAFFYHNPREKARAEGRLTEWPKRVTVAQVMQFYHEKWKRVELDTGTREWLMRVAAGDLLVLGGWLRDMCSGYVVNKKKQAGMLAELRTTSDALPRRPTGKVFHNTAEHSLPGPGEPWEDPKKGWWRTQ